MSVCKACQAAQTIAGRAECRRHREKPIVICSEPGCTSRSRAKGLCVTHYNREYSREYMRRYRARQRETPAPTHDDLDAYLADAPPAVRAAWEEQRAMLRRVEQRLIEATLGPQFTCIGVVPVDTVRKVFRDAI